MVDSDWAADCTHRRSVSSFVIVLAGAAGLYKTCFQTIIALSSIEAEFVAASDAGKMVLYLQSILGNLHINQREATLLYEYNMGAFKMVSAGQPTPRTRDIDICHFTHLDWVENDLIVLEHFLTTLNLANMLTKSTPHILFHRHADVLMGKLRPAYLSKIANSFRFPVSSSDPTP